MARLIHLNGAPGVGKSTLGERYVAEHPGVLNCDIDRLRGFVGGWSDDFDGVGAVVRPLALAMIRAHLDGGRDVILPQMLANERERARFQAAAVDAGHAYVHVLLQAPAGEAATRFYRRPVDDPLQAVIRGVVDDQGGASVIDGLERHLAESADGTGEAIRVEAGGDLETVYRLLIAVLG